jgi:hypothetical protein
LVKEVVPRLTHQSYFYEPHLGGFESLEELAQVSGEVLDLHLPSSTGFRRVQGWEGRYCYGGLVDFVMPAFHWD